MPPFSPLSISATSSAERVVSCFMLYVHPAAARQGVGTMLIDALEKLATARGARRLTADVSDSAQDFFRRRGFVPTQRNTIELGSEWLANTTMEKRLAAKERPQ